MNSAAKAQVSADVHSRLSAEPVVSAEGYVYAKTATSIRGTPEIAEQRAVLEALRLIANKLCEFEPRSGKRLETAILGTTLVASSRVERTVEVVVRVPDQKPMCKVDDIARSPAPPHQSSDPNAMASDKNAEALPQTRLLDPSYQRSDGITTRVFGGEY